jgi:hypothetical protein
VSIYAQKSYQKPTILEELKSIYLQGQLREAANEACGFRRVGGHRLKVLAEPIGEPLAKHHLAGFHHIYFWILED